ncbi:YjfB family protein [Oceanobacillus alkalisoli]|uniref:YjfB family protein n=1 Tax=Oceanobacillus alkalisoli TaxID=2925113 RepID=UPI001EF113C2|nr:YjfB family protein [Oceanobacillus alkalisoli]MCF3942100.1 YjfB family protein [Oceanobacillus alkalisoli]MCG5105039.1 YjfB family protein [Oceanobacillus alkalisoli]
MDIAKLSTVLSQSQVKQQASLSVMKMMMDTGKVQANDMLEMLDEGVSAPDAGHPYLGGKIDIQV